MNRWLIIGLVILLLTTTTYAFNDGNFYLITGQRTSFETETIYSNPDINFVFASSVGTTQTTAKSLEGLKSLSISAGAVSPEVRPFTSNAYNYLWINLGTATNVMDFGTNEYGVGAVCKILVNTTSGHWGSYYGAAAHNLSTELEAPQANTWYLLKMQYTANKCNFWVYKLDGTLVAYSLATTPQTVATATQLVISINNTNTYVDALVNSDTNYVASNFPLNFPPLVVDFNYTIRKDLNKIILKDTSTVVSSLSKTAWLWQSNGVSISNTPDYNYTATQLTDYNICLTVDTNDALYFGTKCYSISTGEWTPPVTTFTSNQVSGTLITTMHFACTDDNSGCRDLNYSFNGTSWTDVNYVPQSTSTSIDINKSGGGIYTVYYKSTDRNNNTESIKTSNFNTYGNIRFNMYDENTGADLNGTQVNFNGSDYVSGTHVYDFDMNGITTGQYTFTITKAGYCNRYYQTDLNQFSDLNISFLMLPSTACTTTQFQFFAPDQTTILSNSFITVTNFAKSGRIAERLKTNALGILNFDLNINSSSYGFHIESIPNYDYNAISVTVYNPKDEATSLDINATWNLEVQGVAVTNDYNITALTNKTLMVYANTYYNYLLRISSNSAAPTYFTRNYAIKLLGYPTGYTLQPYLISSTTGLQTPLQSLNAYTFLPIPNVNIKIYRIMPGTGKTLIEEEVTDGSGNAIVSLVVNQNYIFDVYQDNALVFSSNKTGPSVAGQTIYIYLGEIAAPTGDLNVSFINIGFNPITNSLHKTDSNLIQTVSMTDSTSGLIINSIVIIVTNDYMNIYSQTFNNPTLPFTNGIDFNYYAQTLNGGPYDSNSPLDICVYVNTNLGQVQKCMPYNSPGVFNIQQMFSVNIRGLLTCSADPNVPCPTLLLLALFISITISVLLSIGMGYTNMASIGLFFMFLMGIFTYFTWVPAVLFVIMLVGVLAILIAEGGRRL
jgi:hypothetical protein